MVNRPRASGRAGFTLVEITVGFVVLGLVLLSLASYTSAQRKGLNRSERLSEGTRVAATALETLKGQLADSATFKALFDAVRTRPRVTSEVREINSRHYTIQVTLTRAPAPLYGLQAKARATWGRSHVVELGLLVPGASETL